MRAARITRFDPGAGGNEIVGGIYGADPVEGWYDTNVSTGAPKREQFSQYGLPAVWTKIATQVNSSGFTVATYPDDGGGTLPTSPATDGGSTLKMPATVLQTQAAGLDPTGMLVAIYTGSAAGQLRRVISWVSGTQVLTLSRPWSSSAGGVPAAGDKATLLIDSRYANTVHLKPEFSVNTANFTGTVEYFDFPLTLGATETFRGSIIRGFDSEQVIACLGANYQNNPVETSYYHGPLYSVVSRGMVGVRFRLTAISTGLVSLWMTAA